MHLLKCCQPELVEGGLKHTENSSRLRQAQPDNLREVTFTLSCYKNTKCK